MTSQTLHWHSFDASATAAAALARAVAQPLAEVIARCGPARLAVSGGRSPVLFFDRLSLDQVDWPRVRLMLVDERLVTPGHADSNARLALRYLAMDL